METKINFQPNGANLLVEWYEKTEEESKIIVADHLRKQFNADLNGVNEVVAVGPDCKFAKVGDWVMIGQADTPVLRIDGKPYAMLREHQVTGKFPEGRPEMDTSKGLDMPVEFKTTKTKSKLDNFAKKMTDRAAGDGYN